MFRVIKINPETAKAPKAPEEAVRQILSLTDETEASVFVPHISDPAFICPNVQRAHSFLKTIKQTAKTSNCWNPGDDHEAGAETHKPRLESRLWAWCAFQQHSGLQVPSWFLHGSSRFLHGSSRFSQEQLDGVGRRKCRQTEMP